MARTRGSWLGPAMRPVAVPDDLGDPALPRARGRVELPRHIRWSGLPITNDLDDRGDRARVYEQVLREGAAEDVRYYSTRISCSISGTTSSSRPRSGGRGRGGCGAADATRRC
jgi:hypothetical protein